MLKFDNISKTFNKDTENEVKLFEKFSLDINSHESTALLGSNGCGKTTLLNIVAGTVPLDSGNVYLNGENITSWKEEDRALMIGRVHQNPSDGVAPSLSILENLSLADKKGKSFSFNKLLDKTRIDYYKEILSDLDLGLEYKMNTKVKYLSGGQRQSLSLLMAAMKNPKILLLDEHTAALDPKTSKIILEKTSELLHKMRISTLMISHNMRDAIKYSDRVIMLSRGEVIVDKASNDITEEELIRIYTKEL